MNHDYAHCWDYEKGVCPETCFHAVLTEDLKKWPRSVTYAKIKGTDACPITNPPPKPTNYDRFISKTPEELAEWFSHRVVANSVECPPQHGYKHCLEQDGCRACWLEWLRQEGEA